MIFKNNEITDNRLMGVEFCNLVGKVPFEITCNNISSNLSDGLQINNCSSMKFKSNIVNLNLNGVLINSSKESNHFCEFEKDIFKNNFFNGVSVIFHDKYKLTLSKCHFESNHKYGLYVNSPKDLFENSSLLVNTTGFFMNKIGGIYLENIKACLDKTAISKNEKYAIESVNSRVEFTNYEEDNYKTLISGKLKGNIPVKKQCLLQCVEKICSIF